MTSFQLLDYSFNVLDIRKTFTVNAKQSTLHVCVLVREFPLNRRVNVFDVLCPRVEQGVSGSFHGSESRQGILRDVLTGCATL